MLTRNKKGVSDVIVTVIMIVIALVAIGIVYAVVQGIVKGQSGGAEMAAKCINIGAEMTVSSYPAATNPGPVIGASSYLIVVKRTGSNNDEAGVKLLFKNKQGSTVTPNYGANLVPADQPFKAALETVTFNKVVNTMGSNLVSVEAIPYFKDASGKVQYCEQQKTSVTFTGDCKPSCAANSCGSDDFCNGLCTKCTTGICTEDTDGSWSCIA